MWNPQEDRGVLGFRRQPEAAIAKTAPKPMTTRRTPQSIGRGPDIPGETGVPAMIVVLNVAYPPPGE